MKIGDLVKYNYPGRLRDKFGRSSHALALECIGTVIDFPQAVHAKEFQKVRVLTEGEVEDWIMQFCEVISEECTKM